MCSILCVAHMTWADMVHSAGHGRIMGVHSAGDQKKLSQRLPSVWGRWEAGWDYYHDQFTGTSAPRSSACLSQELEWSEVVYINVWYYSRLFHDEKNFAL